MKLRKTLAAAGALAIAGGMFAMSPAQAAQTGSTDATFEITAGTLDITVPASTVNLGSVNAGLNQLVGDLGTVEVVDNRGLLAAIWTASAQTTAFTTGTADPVSETVPAASIAYAATAQASSGGGGTAVFAFPGASALSDTLATPVASLALGVGVNEASWNAQLTFTLLPTQVAGVYEGTVTHSVL